MKQGGSQNAVFRRKLLAASVAACFAVSATQLSAQVLPTGATGVVGVTGISQAGSTLTVNTSGNSVLNYTSFSIGAGATVQINQQSAAFASLQRVIGAGGVIPQSVIDGMLNSNGRVFLLNPAGVVIGAGARIDVAGFVASSLNMSDDDFLNGRMRFTENAAAKAVKNFGEITTAKGGHVYLVAPEVENHGIIRAPGGQIVLAAGKSAELISDASPYVTVKVVADVEKALNVGKLIADSGSIGMFGALVQHTGEAVASGAVVGPGGQIRFVATKDLTIDSGSRIAANGTSGGQIVLQAEGGTNLIGGTVEAKGSAGKGGEVQALGVRVGVIGNGIIDASGEAGGGTVLVGGDYQGKNSAIQNAERTLIGADGVIRADAGANGDGGRVIVWADGDTRFYGHISAKGGSQSGNGGFVETSGKGRLVALGSVNAGAPNGKAGTWLLDPENITIVSGSGRDDGEIDDGFLGAGETPGGYGDSIIGTFGIDNAMGMGGPYGTHVVLQANNDITLETSIDTTIYGNGKNLTLAAGHDIDLASYGITTSGDLTLSAGHQITGSGNSLSSAYGAVKLSGTANITGTFTITAETEITTGAVNVLSGGSSDLSMSARDGFISTGPLSVSVGDGDAYLSLTAGGNDGNITVNGSIRVDGCCEAIVDIDAGGFISTQAITTNGSDDNSITLTALGNVTTGALTTRANQAGVYGGAVSITTTNGRVVVGDIDTRGNDGDEFNFDGGDGGSVTIQRLSGTPPGDGAPAVQVNGAIRTGGGNGSQNPYGGVGSGGQGGDVNINAYGFGSPMQGGVSTGSIDTSGGIGGNAFSANGGDGGAAGNVGIFATGAVSIPSITSSGGAGGSEFSFGYGGEGHSGGEIIVTGGSVAIDALTARGGRGGDGPEGGGNGGSGGDVVLTATAGLLQVATIDVGGSSGGNGSGSCCSFSFAPSGGMGGSADLQGSSDVSVVFINAKGGAGGSWTGASGLVGGDGGEGGWVDLSAGGLLSVGPKNPLIGQASKVVDISGGAGGSGGHGQSPGGDGGGGGEGGVAFLDAPNMIITGFIDGTGAAGGAGGIGAGGEPNGATGFGGDGGDIGFNTGSSTGIIQFVNGGWDLTLGVGGGSASDGQINSNGNFILPAELMVAKLIHVGPGDLTDIPTDYGIFRFTGVSDPLAIATVAQQVGLLQAESGAGESSEEEDEEKEKTGSLGSCRPS